MPLIQGRIARQEIKITFVFYIPYEYALASIQHDRQGMIIVSAELLFALDVLFCSHCDYIFCSL